MIPHAFSGGGTAHWCSGMVAITLLPPLHTAGRDAGLPPASSLLRLAISRRITSCEWRWVSSVLPLSVRPTTPSFTRTRICPAHGLARLLLSHSVYPAVRPSLLLLVPGMLRF